MAAPQLAHALQRALPAGAVATAACWQPLHRHVLEMSPDDVRGHTEAQVSAQFGTDQHVVVTLHEGDVDPAEAPDLAEALRRTEGGVLVVGIGFDSGPARSGPRHSPCPECGAVEAEQLDAGPADAHRPPVYGQLFQCLSCGSVWDE